MQINQVRKETGLTNKAIEYYTAQGLLAPGILTNGYRDYGKKEVELLRKIAVLRRLSLSVDEIKKVLGGEGNGLALQEVLLQKDLKLRADAIRKELLTRLSEGAEYETIETDLRTLEQSKTVTEKLLEAFPGNFGRFICLHFSRFLDEPIESDHQQAAFEAMIDFLDHMPPMNLSEDIQNYFEENTRHLGNEQITRMLGQVRHSIENTEEFLEEKGEFLARYLEYKQSPEYRNSQAAKLEEQLKDFYQTSGYYEVFIPLLRQVSSSYEAYYRQLESANEMILNKYPNALATGGEAFPPG